MPLPRPVLLGRVEAHRAVDQRVALLEMEALCGRVNAYICSAADGDSHSGRTPALRGPDAAYGAKEMHVAPCRGPLHWPTEPVRLWQTVDINDRRELVRPA